MAAAGAAGPQCRITTFNIQWKDEETDHVLTARMENVVKILNCFEADVITLQEVSERMLGILRGKLQDNFHFCTYQYRERGQRGYLVTLVRKSSDWELVGPDCAANRLTYPKDPDHVPAVCKQSRLRCSLTLGMLVAVLKYPKGRPPTHQLLLGNTHLSAGGTWDGGKRGDKGGKARDPALLGRLRVDQLHLALKTLQDRCANRVDECVSAAVLAGDMNIREIEDKGGLNNNTPSVPDVMESFGFKDAAIVSGSVTSTLPEAKPTNLNRRFDRILLHNVNCSSFVVDRRNHIDGASDHFCVASCIELDTQKGFK